MVNSKILGGIIAIVIIGIVFAVIGTTTNDVPTNNSELTISDSAELEKNTEIPNNPDFTIDENGNKRYVISVVDSPILGE